MKWNAPFAGGTSRKRLLAASGATAIAAAGLLGLSPANSAQAVGPTSSCSFADAGSGTYADTLCWLDLSSYDPALAAQGQPLTVSIPGGYTLSATITSTGGEVAPHAFPTWDGAYLGTKGHYTGVTGSPALYQTQNATTTTSTLTDIKVIDKNGSLVTGYALVGADAESTDSKESLTWRSDVPINSINDLGNACAGGFTGAGTTEVTCTGAGTDAKTGTAILAAASPSTFSQTMRGGGKEGFAFGVLISRVQLDKTVESGYEGDSFALSIGDSNGNPVAAANTNGGTSASTGAEPVIVDSKGSDFTFAESGAPGSLTNYSHEWICTRNGQEDSSLPSGVAAPSQKIHVGIGDSLKCGITNTGLPRGLSLVKHAGKAVDVNRDGLVDAGDTIHYTFTITNTGQVPMTGLAVQDEKVGAVTCPTQPLAVGASTTCSAVKPYTITAADVEAGSVDNVATATGHAVGNNENVTTDPSSTHTPTATPKPSMTLLKAASASRATQPGQVITYSFKVTNTGNVPIFDLRIKEGAFTGHGNMTPSTCPTQVLAVGSTVTCTASYRVVAEDLVQDGTLSNTATAAGKTPDGDDLISNPSTVKITEVKMPPAPPAPPAPAPPAPEGELAHTGADVGIFGAVGAGILALGSVLALSLRRRKGLAVK